MILKDRTGRFDRNDPARAEKGILMHGNCRQFNHKKRRFAVRRMIKFAVFIASIFSRKNGLPLPLKTRAA
ncbi:MAG: hypothetical protein AABM33_06115 [Pseudomonadota bacterium]